MNNNQNNDLTSQFYLVLPFVLGIIKDKSGHILIGKHPDLKRKPYPKYWDLPGGKLEKGESPEEGIAREVKEELNLTVTDLTLFGIFHHTQGTMLPECTSTLPGIALCYLLTTSGNIDSREQDDIHFADQDELRSYVSQMTPWTKYFISKIYNW